MASKDLQLYGGKGLNFQSWQISLAGAMFGIASLVGIFFSNQFADRNFAAEKFLAFSHLIGGLALLATSYVREFGRSLSASWSMAFFMFPRYR